MITRFRTARFVAPLALLALLGACASGDETPVDNDADAAEPPAEPPPPAGVRVGVVLPPADEFDPRILESMRRDAALVQLMGAGEIYDLRVVVPDDDVFVGDLVDLFARDRYDLTCALTTGASSAVRTAFADAPDQRFCLLVTTELASEEPPGLDVAVLRTAELGYVVGTAAAASTVSGTVAVVLGTHDLDRGRLRDGIVAALGAVEVIERQIDEDPTEMLAAAIDAGADVVIVGSGPRSGEVASAAADAGLVVLAPRAVVDDLDAAGLALTWRIQWHRVLRGPVDRLLGRENPAPRSVGLADDAFVVAPGPAITPTADAQMRTVITQIIAGELDPRVSSAPPVESGGPPAPVDDDPATSSSWPSPQRTMRPTPHVTTTTADKGGRCAEQRSSPHSDLRSTTRHDWPRRSRPGSTSSV